MNNKYKNTNRILVGESNPVHQKTIANTFRQAGYAIDIVTNGITLNKIIEKDWYSHIFIDSRLPQFDCDLMAQYLRKAERIHEAPSLLIALTTNVFPSAWDEALFDSSIAKPLQADSLRVYLNPSLVVATH